MVYVYKYMEIMFNNFPPLSDLKLRGVGLSEQPWRWRGDTFGVLVGFLCCPALGDSQVPEASVPCRAEGNWGWQSLCGSHLHTDLLGRILRGRKIGS